MLSWWIGAAPVEVSADGAGGRDDLQVTLRYPDGSLGSITYLANGHPRFPKETFEAFSGGRSARLDNFRRATVWAGRRRTTSTAWGSPDKGQRDEVAAFLASVRSGSPCPSRWARWSPPPGPRWRRRPAWRARAPVRVSELGARAQGRVETSDGR